MATNNIQQNTFIPAIGTLPAGWGCTRVHNLFTEIVDRYDSKKDPSLPLLSVSEYYGVAERAEKIDEGEILVRASSLDGYKKCHAGDLVSNIMLTWRGALGVSPKDGIVSPAYCVYRPISDVCGKYYHYLFRTQRYADIFRIHSTGLIDSRLRLYSAKFFAIKVPFPPLNEQKKIAKFLDEQCEKIDSICKEAQSSIHEYKSWKSSIIYEAVTKGLDPNVETKDSGIEWIGKIPVNSFATRLKYIVEQIQSGTSVNSGQSPAKDEELGILKTSCVSKYFFNPNENKSINRDEYSRATCSVKKGTVIVSRMNTPELVGACGYVTEDYSNLFLPDRLWQVSFKEGVNVRFVWYYLQSQTTRQYYASLATGTSSSMQNISQAQFLNAPIIMLSENEQRKVVAFLDKKCEQIEELIAEKSMLISDLETYKKSLIYEVVTGKRKVV